MNVDHCCPNDPQTQSATMAPYPPRALLPLLLLLLVAAAHAGDPSYSECPRNVNYTRGRGGVLQFQANLDSLLSSLPAAAAGATSGFATNATGAAPDRAYGLAQCRADVTASDCLACLNASARDMAGKCPGRRNSMLVHDTCLLRHASASFFGAADTSRVKYRWDPQNATQPERLASLLGPLMRSLTERAAYASPRMFAVGTVDVTSSGRIYGMAQCTRDLGKDDCYSCLVTAVSRIPTCCAGKRGGQVIFRTCSIRFEVYPFFSTSSEAAMLGTPPPPPPPPQPAGQIMGGMDENSKISLSNALCVYKKASDACHLNGKCYCCDVTDLCYLTVAQCKKYCEGSPH
ncbi:hypothetical protein ACQJBY_012504 [Aegilops geniculata]